MPPVTRHHNPGSTDWGLAASWHDGYGAASAVPLDTDNLYFGQGQDAVTGTMNQSAIDLTSLTGTTGFGGRVGGAGAPLQLDVNQASTGIWEKGDNGVWYWTGTIWTMNMRRGTFNATGGTIDKLNIWGGEMNVEDGCDLNGNPVVINGGVVSIDYKAGDAPNIVQHGGVLYCYRTFGTYTINGGRGVIRVENTANAGATLTINGDGSIDYQAGNMSTTIAGNDGGLTFANMVRPITIAAATYAGVKVTNRNGANGLVVTYSSGPTLSSPPDPGVD